MNRRLSYNVPGSTRRPPIARYLRGVAPRLPFLPPPASTTQPVSAVDERRFVSAALLFLFFPRVLLFFEPSLARNSVTSAVPHLSAGLEFSQLGRLYPRERYLSGRRRFCLLWECVRVKV